MKTLPFVVIGLIATAVAITQFGLLGGQRPTDLGVKAGMLKAPSPTRNSVSSQAALFPNHPQREYANIKPFPIKNGNGDASIQALGALIGSMPNMRVVNRQADYLHAEAESRWLRFTDDLELWVNPVLDVIEVRSASRLGSDDFGVNRERVETIRTAYLATP